ncbi:MAG TPA: hypothetical protein VMT79_19710 [Candidatus Binatia bacterium]|nr:hypothetical protein [Candidatus Binatia bacterium]
MGVHEGEDGVLGAGIDDHGSLASADRAVSVAAAPTVGTLGPGGFPGVRVLFFG